MPVISYTCPGCTATMKTANPLPDGKMIRCPRCARVFAVKSTAPPPPPAALAAKDTKLVVPGARETKLVAQQVKETKLAAQKSKETKLVPQQAKATKLAAQQSKETKLASAKAKETKLAAPPTSVPPKPAADANGAAGQPFRITCPSCRMTAHWRAGSPPPLGKTVKCPRCSCPFQVPAGPKTVPPAASKTTAPAVRKPAAVVQPPPGGPKSTPAVDASVVKYTCPHCAVKVRTAKPLPAGTTIKCPGCSRKFGVPPTLAAKAQLRPRDTKLAAPNAKPTKLSAPTRPASDPRVPAKPTRLTAPPAAPKPAAGKGPSQPKPVGRITCPSCKVVLKIVGLPPEGKVIRCPKCTKSFRLRPKTAPPTATGKPQPATRSTRTSGGPASKPTVTTAATTADRSRPGPAVVAPWRRPWVSYVVVAVIGLGLVSFGLFLAADYFSRDIPESAWALFSPPDGRCRILMPGQPEAEAASVPGTGAVSSQKFTVRRDKEGAVFLLTLSDRSAAVTGKMTFEELFAPVRTYIRDSVNGTILKEADIFLDTHAGKELQVEPVAGGIVIARVYLVRGQPHDRLYILFVGDARAPSASADGDASKFFDSFKIGIAQPASEPREKRARPHHVIGEVSLPMTPLEEARDVLPLWVIPAAALVFIPAAFLLAFIGSWLATLCAGGLTRPSPTLSWVEQARRLNPGQVVSVLCLLTFPLFIGVAAFGFTSPIAFPPPIVVAVLAGLAAFVGALLIRLRVERRWRPVPPTLGSWLRGLLVTWLLLLPALGVLLVVGLLMPATMNAWAIAVFVLGVILMGFFSGGGGLLVGQVFGLVKPASGRLGAIVAQAADQVGARPRATYEIDWPWANAFAFPMCRRLAFTGPILDQLSDEELTVVCAHELGHLSEPVAVGLARSAIAFTLLPLVAVRPILDAFGPCTYIAFVSVPIVTGFLVNRLARRMEERADRVAHAHEDKPGVYARALEKIHRANMTPVVMSGRREIHPHLYDRLIAAGITPDYPRPRPPSQFRIGVSYAMGLAVVIGALVALGVTVADPTTDANESALLWSLALGGGSDRELANLAGAYYQRGDRDGAIVLYRAAEAINESSVSYPAYRAIVLAACDRLEEAEAALERAEALGDDSHASTVAIAAARQAIELCRTRRSALTSLAAEPGRETNQPVANAVTIV